VTLVVGFALHYRPILIGDLLLSAPERGGESVWLPMSGFSERIFPPGSGYVVEGLRQKVAIVSANCAVAWADSGIAARHIIKALRARARETTLTYEKIVRVMEDTKPDLGSLSADIIGWVSDPTSHQSFRFGNTSRFMTPAFGGVYVAGSGKDSFERLANAPMGDPQGVVNATGFDIAIARAHSVTALLLQGELIDRGPILRYFGGGYEVAVHDGRRFQKLGDTTYIFSSAEQRKRNGPIFLDPRVHIVGQSYRRDLLLIRSASVDLHHDWRPADVANHAVHLIPPIYRDATPRERLSRVVPRFSARHVCHAVLVRLPNGRRTVDFRFERNSRESPTIVIRERPRRQLTFGFKDGFAETLRRGLRDHIDAERRARRRSLVRGLLSWRPFRS
jgi:hypothetical protein